MAINPQVKVTQMCGVMLSKVALTVVDRFLMPEPKLGDLRDDMIRVIDESEPKVAAVRAKQQQSRVPQMRGEIAQEIAEPVSYVRPMPPQQQDATIYIQKSLDALAQAKQATTCKVCQTEIDSAARDVERRLSVIRHTDKMFQAMKDLEAQGALPKGSKWSALKETERELVRTRVRG